MFKEDQLGNVSHNGNLACFSYINLGQKKSDVCINQKLANFDVVSVFCILSDFVGDIVFTKDVKAEAHVPTSINAYKGTGKNVASAGADAGDGGDNGEARIRELEASQAEAQKLADEKAKEADASAKALEAKTKEADALKAQLEEQAAGDNGGGGGNPRQTRFNDKRQG